MNASSIFVSAFVLSISTLVGAPPDRLGEVFGPLFTAPPVPSTVSKPLPGPNPSSIYRWNQIAIDAAGLDHTPETSGPPHVFGQNLGPGRSSRALAIVHIAIFDAVNAVFGGYRSFASVAPPLGSPSLDAAISQAAHDTLAALYPSQAGIFDSLLADDLAGVTNVTELANGVDLGRRSAAAILALKANDGSEIPEVRVGTEPGPDIGYVTSNKVGHWRQDPISLIPLALGVHWGACVPFVLKSGQQFRVSAPPRLTSPAYTAAYNEAKRLGGETSLQRTAEQTFIGTFWAYDGTPSMCAPPRLYNQITRQIAVQTKLGLVDLARLLALVNVAMADAGIAVWESKYFYDFWRPITGIRESDPGTGPTGDGDRNPATIGDPTFKPLGAPASNLAGPNFTPPFPAYPSGHAGFGGALFQTLRRFYGTDRMTFTFVSDEFNGVTKDNNGVTRPLIPRTFTAFSQAEEENGQSRIYLGIHWAFDKIAGIAQGRRVGNYVFENAFVRLGRGGR